MSWLPPCFHLDVTRHREIASSQLEEGLQATAPEGSGDAGGNPGADPDGPLGTRCSRRPLRFDGTQPGNECHQKFSEVQGYFGWKVPHYTR